MIRPFHGLWRKVLARLRRPLRAPAGARSVVLGGRTFHVPRLPLGVTIQVYPICKRLTEAGLAERFMAGVLVGEDEINDLVELAFQAAHAADGSLDTEAFLAMPVSVLELFGAFLVVRLQTGAWSLAEGRDDPGEGRGTDPSATGTSPT